MSGQNFAHDEHAASVATAVELGRQDGPREDGTADRARCDIGGGWYKETDAAIQGWLTRAYD